MVIKLLEWFHERSSKGLRVSLKHFMKKAKILHNNMVKKARQENFLWRFSGKNWLTKNMYELLLITTVTKKFSTSQKDPD